MKTIIIEVSDEFIQQAIREGRHKSEAEVLKWLKRYLQEVIKIFPEAWSLAKATGKIDIPSVVSTVKGNIAQEDAKKEAKP